MTDDDIFEGLDDEEEGAPEDGILTLTDDEGNEVDFEFLDLIEFEGKEYVVMLPAEETDEADTVVVLQLLESENGDETYVSVEDDRVLNAVFGIFKEKFADEFDFVD